MGDSTKEVSTYSPLYAYFHTYSCTSTLIYCFTDGVNKIVVVVVVVVVVDGKILFSP